jgi:CubicO group peptidase (beta-lactamase class C family)
MANITVGRAAAATASDPALSPALGEVDQALRQAVNAQTVPSLVAIAANDKGVVYEGAFGPSITADSVFWIASMTKAITGAACMQLEHIPLTFSHTPHAQRNLHIRGD